MKNIFNKILALAVVFTIASCDSLLDINEDPDQSSSARIQEVLTSGQAYMNYMIGAQFNGQRSKIWSQYVAWGPGVSLGPDPRNEYAATSSDSRWRYAYARSLRDLKFVVDSDEPVYAAIAKLTMAYEFQILVDHFGDIPYSEALQGSIDDGSLLNPTFDDAATIYASLVSLVDEAIAQIENAPSNALIPGANDLIYGGDTDQWIKFGNSLKLKLLMRQSIQGGPADLSTQVAAVVANGNFIESSSDNATIVSGGLAGSEHPYVALLESGLGNFYVLNNAFKNVLEGLSDPRLDEMYDTPESGGGHNGEDPGAVLNSTLQKADYSTQSSKLYDASLPVNYITSTEVKFYRAEAALLYSTEDPVTTFESAVTSSFADLGITSDAAAYLAGIDFANSGAKMSDLAIQLWIAMNGTSQSAEGWITTRKFDDGSNGLFGSIGGAFITPLENNLGGRNFPSILLYPQTEIATNPNFPGQHQLTDKVFWDK